MKRKRRLFGTDGIRGIANSEPMTAWTALAIGTAAARYFRKRKHHHRVVIGKDTRLSGYMIESALEAGFISMGMDVYLVGPLPTPAVAMLTRSLRADLGVMISASHNTYEYNGIKLFGPDGYKLSDEVERQIEDDVNRGQQDCLVSPDDLGRAQRVEDAHGRYNEFAKRAFPKGMTLEGLKLVVDCAHGAAYKVVPEVLWELGAQVIPVGVEPCGFNINAECGSTNGAFLSSQVLKNGAAVGIALDGDGDRVLLCDETGKLVDGDQVLGMIAANWHEKKKLRGGGIATTIMSNMGLERYLEAQGLSLTRTRVGDRYVAEEMRNRGFNLGGEQSGHVIMSDYGTTGDGLIAALQVLAVLVKKERPTSEVCHVFDPWPQVLRGVSFTHQDPLEAEGVKAVISDCQNRLGDQGRLLVRKSGTEPLIRVMVEGEDDTMITSVVDDITAIIEDTVTKAGEEQDRR